MREYRIFILLFLFAAATSMFFSCTKEDALGLASEIELQSPYGNWKLRGYGATDSNQEKIVLADPNAFYLTLNNDSTYKGTSSTNEISGKFKIDSRRGVIIFSQTNFYSTNRFDETGAGTSYLSNLLKVTNFRVYPIKKELHLYYSEKDYLLFVKLDN